MNIKKEIKNIENKIYMNVTDIEITDSKYKQHPDAWKYAMDMTIKEIHQAVEGLYHNLNTLQLNKQLKMAA